MTAEEIKNILSLTSAVSLQTAEDLKPYTQLRFLKKGVFLEKSGAPIKYEFIVKQGIVRKYLSNSEGREFTTGFFLPEQAVTPTLLRSIDFISFVCLEVISSSAEVLYFSLSGMQKAMKGNKDLEQFGFTVMMREAFAMAEREKILLTATGKEKMAWFRKNYPNLENKIPHYYIASFLGLTPTSFSRLRAGKK
jgi:CRP-like cAMP-binding protein